MEFITGLLVGMCMFMGYLLYISKKPSKLVEIDKREQEEQERREKHLQALLNYDVDTAYNGGRR
jgi:hypothetical protein